MHYTIYKITNTVNGKTYIGKHQTKDLDDGYMGSGKLLKAAIKKYGIESFTKEILHDFDNEADMNAKEAELVVVSEDTYNLCPGGHGGWGYINSNDDILSKRDTAENKRKGYEAAKLWKHSNNWLGKPLSNDTKQKISKALKGQQFFLGKSHSEETKRKIGEANKSLIGEKNGSFGKVWITNGIDSKMIKKGLDSIPEGWYTGRVIKS